MSENKFFLDSNIFVYSFAAGSPVKQEVSQKLIEKALGTRMGIISYQVVQEVLNVALKKFETVIRFEDVQNTLEDLLLPLCRVYPDRALYQKSLAIRGQYGFSFYDSLIIAAAIREDCRALYTEDLQDGQDVEDILIVNPFKI